MDTAEQKRVYAKTHYENNKRQYIERAERSKARIREWYQDLKDAATCSVCGEDDNACLEFHHVEEKLFEISSHLLRVSRRRMEEELAKCVVLCANCHRKHHAGTLYASIAQMDRAFACEAKGRTFESC